MRAYTIPTILGACLALAACNEALVPDYNTATGYQHSIGALQSEFTGMFGAMKLDEFRYDFAAEGFARNGAYYTPSEVRFVTELTGFAQLDDDNFGALVWNLPYQAIKDADSLAGVMPTLTTATGAPMPAANLKALLGVTETIKAMDYMFILLSHDTNGVAMNSTGQPFTGTLAPILCARDSWKEILFMLDSAKANLDAAGPNTAFGWPGTAFASLQVPLGFAQVGANAGAFEAFTLALRGRARLEYAYAIARGPGGNAPTATTAGSPDQNQLDSAIIDITSSALYSPTLSAEEAIAANDAGVFFSYSGEAGDQPNQVFQTGAAYYAFEGAVKQIDSLHDKRFLAKFAIASALPTSTGASAASSYAYLNNTSITQPMPITRNLQLQFLLARAYLGTGQFVKAAQTVDAVRTVVGGLASGLAGVNTSDYVSTRDFLMKEMLPTMIADGEGEQIAAIRDYGLIMQDLETWAPNDYHTSVENIPAIEQQQRHGNYQPVCQ